MKDESKLIRLFCNLLFCIFTFCFVFFYQADTLTIAQHIASNGQTHYVSWLGAILITLTLQLLQWAVNSLFKLKKRGYALTFFPSVLFLTIITDINPDTSNTITFGAWAWIAPLLLVIWGASMVYIKNYEPYEPALRGEGLGSQLFWVNNLIMLLMFCSMGLYSNSDSLFHKKAHIEALVRNKEYSEALKVIQKCGLSDSTTTMLTIYSLAHKGQLADKLFEYNLVGGKDVLRPGKVHSLLIQNSIIHKATKKSAQYQLVGFLLDKNLDKFAHYVRIYYPNDSLLPRYYKEAYNLKKIIDKRRKPVPPYKKGSYTKYYYEKL